MNIKERKMKKTVIMVVALLVAVPCVFAQVGPGHIKKMSKELQLELGAETPLLNKIRDQVIRKVAAQKLEAVFISDELDEGLVRALLNLHCDISDAKQENVQAILRDSIDVYDAIIEDFAENPDVAYLGEEIRPNDEDKLAAVCHALQQAQNTKWGTSLVLADYIETNLENEEVLRAFPPAEQARLIALKNLLVRYSKKTTEEEDISAPDITGGDLYHI